MTTAQLIDTFIQAAHQASVIPLASEATIYAMKAFGGFDLRLPIAAAVAGGTLGCVFNWWVGRMLMKLPSSPKNQRIFLKLQEQFNRYGYWLLLASFLPLGNILLVAAGMFATPIKKALPVAAAGLLFHYGLLLK